MQNSIQDARLNLSNVKISWDFASCKLNTIKNKSRYLKGDKKLQKGQSPLNPFVDRKARMIALAHTIQPWTFVVNGYWSNVLKLPMCPCNHNENDKGDVCLRVSRKVVHYHGIIESTIDLTFWIESIV